MNLTRTRVARILIVGATLGMTIGLASAGLTAAAAEPSTAPAPPATEPVAETTPPTNDAVAEPATTTVGATPLSPECTDYRFNDQYPLRLCDESPGVRRAQEQLRVAVDASLVAHGYFGPATEQAVGTFQAENGLQVDGLIGPDTWAVLTAEQPGSDVDGSGVVDPWEVVASVESVEPSSELPTALPLSIGASGPPVAKLQNLLLSAGIWVGDSGADGHFGLDTARAVAMIPPSQVSMETGEPGALGVMTGDRLDDLMRFSAENTPLIVNGLCAEPSALLAAAAGTGRTAFRISDIRCSSGWAMTYSVDYAWNDSDQLFFRLSGSDPVLAGSHYGPDNGCLLNGVPAEAWPAFGCAPVPPPPPPVIDPPSCDTYSFNDQYPMRRCDEGYAVYMIQQALVNRGYRLDVDGYFGPGTEQAVRDFQWIEGLEVDGLVGPNTWSTLVGAPGWDRDGNGIIDPDEVAGE